MKINITLDIEPNEIALANEIIATLRTLTSNVSVTQRDGQNGQPQRSASVSSAASVPPPQSATGPAPAVLASSSARSASSQLPAGPVVSKADPVVAPLARQPTPPTPLSPSRQPPMSVAHAQPQPQQPSNEQNIAMDPHTYEELVRQLANAEESRETADEISRLLTVSGGAAFDTFLSVFMRVAFPAETQQMPKTVVPFITCIANLSDPWKGRMRDKVIPLILKHLTVKRQLTDLRTEFFAQAEAFAALVQLQLIAVGGAVKTIVALLRKPDNRLAAITMLGKTSELCYDQLTVECDPGMLTSLREALDLCTENVFKYDLEYINDVMGWGPDAQPKSLSGPVASWQGHTDTIFALAYDAARHRIISGARDSQVIMWDEAGRQVGPPQSVSASFICGVDYIPQPQLLVVGGVPMNRSAPGAQSRVAAFRVGADALVPAGSLVPPRIKLLSTLRALPETTGFVTGETLVPEPTGQAEHVVRFYDVAGGSSFQSLQPTVTFPGHTQMVTATSPCPGQPSLIVSGSKDGSALLWDVRAPRAPAGCFATPPAAGAQAANMLTSLDASDTMLLAGGTNKTVTQWDFRAMQTGGKVTNSLRALHVDDSTVLKVAIGSSLSAVAVTTFHGLYLGDFSGEGQPAMERAQMRTVGDKVQHYHDIKWARDRGTLYAGGIAKSVDSFELA